MSIPYFLRRISEPKTMEAVEMKAFEDLSVQNYKRWFIPLVDHALEWARLSGRKMILDVACGPGFLVRELASRSPSFRVTGIDTSKYGIRLARKNSEGFTNTQFLVGSVYQLPFPSESFDLVMCKDSFHHFNNPCRALAEMWRVLKPLGTLYLHDLRRDLPRYLLQRATPRRTVIQKLQFYSTRASYTKSEVRAFFWSLKIRPRAVATRVVTSTIKKRYKRLGIDHHQLKEGFQARFFAVAQRK